MKDRERRSTQPEISYPVMSDSQGMNPELLQPEANYNEQLSQPKLESK